MVVVASWIFTLVVSNHEDFSDILEAIDPNQYGTLRFTIANLKSLNYRRGDTLFGSVRVCSRCSGHKGVLHEYNSTVHNNPKMYLCSKCSDELDYLYSEEELNKTFGVNPLYFHPPTGDVEKEKAIQRFMDACADPENDFFRKQSVERQYNKTIWQITDKNGMMRILGSSPYQLLVWDIMGANNQLKENGFSEYALTTTEYEELRKLYFGKYTYGLENFDK